MWFYGNRTKQHVSIGQWLIAIPVTKPKCDEGKIFSGSWTQLNNENQLQFKLDHNAPNAAVHHLCCLSDDNDIGSFLSRAETKGENVGFNGSEVHHKDD